MRNEGKTFFREAMSLSSNDGYRNYLESKLDEDRECGEWENIKLGTNGVNV